MTWSGATAVAVATFAVAAVLALAWPERDDAGSPPLRIPALGGGGTTLVVDSFGRPVKRVADARQAGAARRWLARARPLGDGAPAWARHMYLRSLLVLRALTDPRSGASVAGAREGWAYVWPRDAGTAAIAFAAAGYRAEARRVARFLLGLDMEAAARFRPDGTPVPGRDAQGDAAGWVAAAAWAAGLPPGPDGAVGAEPRRRPLSASPVPPDWRGRADYHEKSVGDYLANALASTASGVLYVPLGHIKHTGTGSDGRLEAFRSPGASGGGGGGGNRGRAGDAAAVAAAASASASAAAAAGTLLRVAGDPDSGWDSAAAWGVRPFAQPALYPAIRRTLRRIAAGSGRFGILPSENWDGGVDPWTAPTAWVAWGLAALAREDRRAAGRLHVGGNRPAALRKDAAALGERRAALHLMAAVRRASTPTGLIPERVDARTGLPTSTTPLAWSHAFAILAIRELWPVRAAWR